MVHRLTVGSDSRSSKPIAHIYLVRRLSLRISAHISEVTSYKDPTISAIGAQCDERPSASDCPDDSDTHLVRLHCYPQLWPFIKRIWFDSMDLHVYGLGLWAGTLPFLGTHIICKKRVINTTVVVYLLLYCVVPHLLLVMLVPYIDPLYPGGSLEYEVGIKPGMSYLFVAIPHTFSKHQLSPAMALLLYTTYILVGIQHLSLNILMIWENVWPSLPKAVITFFKKIQLLLASFCFLSFILTIPYLTQCGIYLYQIIRFYVDRLLFALIIFSMVPCVIGFIRQEALRTPIDRIFMGLWYSIASVITACLLIHNFVVFMYPEAVVSYEQRWAENLGWCVSVSPLVLGVVSGVIHTILKQPGSFKEKLIGSLRTGTLPPSEAAEDCLSLDTGDTDLKSACTSRHTTPLSQARAPLLKHHTTLSETNSQSGNSHTLFPQNLAKLPLSKTRLQNDSNHYCINSPTAGGELFSPDNSVLGYGTLQVHKNKASVEVVIRSASDGNIVQL
ncbi:unnamed protein product [Candidula unifasciata]|uniref:Uncharacterized protein n=1 Tax=Candidula unifasciata TaxID=100452 RepID=A0A8S3ZVX1_9EUPU|nr:unnamed protein product [Candidula unifasciata]